MILSVVVYSCVVVSTMGDLSKSSSDGDDEALRGVELTKAGRLVAPKSTLALVWLALRWRKPSSLSDLMKFDRIEHDNRGITK